MSADALAQSVRGGRSTPAPANALWPAFAQGGRFWALRYLLAGEDRRRHCLSEPVGKVGKARFGKIGGHAGRSPDRVVSVGGEVVHKAIAQELDAELLDGAPEASGERL